MTRYLEVRLYSVGLTLVRVTVLVFLMLRRGDVGTSWRTGKPVLHLSLERLPGTLELTARRTILFVSVLFMTINLAVELVQP